MPTAIGNTVAASSAFVESPAIARGTVARAAKSNLVVPSTAIALPAAARKPTAIRRPPPRFALTGQSTQMIVGADRTDDRTILALSGNMYASYGLRRVYYSAFSPIPDASRSLPPVAPPLVREHRLYQADWLVRFYGFACDEVVGGESGMLDLDIDPKLSWALAHREQFPVDLNRAPRELMLRVPGLGVKAVDRLIGSRRARQVRTDDLARLRVSAAKVLPFVVMADHTPGRDADSATLGARLRPQPKQASLFDA
jgi:predicted DNA-binding helix-hairpin-helix protein